MSDGKGQGDSTAIILIVLIIVGVLVVYLYFQNAGSIGLPSFLQSNQVVYSDDVVQVIDKFISDQSLYEGQKTTIEFIVVNNGPKDVKGVEVKLDPPTGLTSDMKCGDKPSCTFDLQKGEPVDVLITLTAAQGVTQITTADVHYSVSYSYDGEREFKMPIINSKNPPVGQEFSAGSNTYGPIHLGYTAPSARPISGRGAAIYAYSDIPFDMSFSVQHVGGAFGIGKTEPIIMSGDQLKIDRLDGFDLVRCDKIETSTMSLIDFSKVAGDRLRALTGFEVPFDFECTFQPNKKDEFYDGVISFKFNYPYKMAFSDTFTILPKGDGSGESDQSEATGGGTPSSSTPESSTGSNPIVITGPANEDTTVSGLSISSDKASYSSGEKIKVLGTISPASSGVQVTVRLTDSSGNIVAIDQRPTDSSGSFSSTLSPSSYSNKGTWKILATAPNGLKHETTVTVS